MTRSWSLSALFAFFVTPWGLLLLSVLDSSVLFFAHLANDAVVVTLAARNPDRFWLYPLIATAGSVIGVASTFWVGHTVGEPGLERFIHPRRLAKVKQRVKNTGALALAAFALVPPPFPLTPLVLACGALDVDHRKFFITVA